jgi:cell division initiation protein
MEMLPNDIRQHLFRRGMRGYDTEEVDQFLEHVATVLEDALAARRSAELAQERLEQEIQRFREQEGALKQAVVTVQSAMARAREATDQEVASLQRKAEAEARSILQKAEVERQKLELDLHYLRESRRNYIEQFRAFCEAQLRTLDGVEGLGTAKSAAAEAELMQHAVKQVQPPPPPTPPAPPHIEGPQHWAPPRIERRYAAGGPKAAEGAVVFPPPLVPARDKSFDT